MDSININTDKFCRTCLKEDLSVALFTIDMNTGIRPFEMLIKLANIQVYNIGFIILLIILTNYFLDLRKGQASEINLFRLLLQVIRSISL